MKKTIILMSLFLLSACDGWMQDFDPWGKMGKEICDQYGNNCQPACTVYGNCSAEQIETGTRETRSCDLYGNCDGGGASGSSPDSGSSGGSIWGGQSE